MTRAGYHSGGTRCDSDGAGCDTDGTGCDSDGGRV